MTVNKFLQFVDTLVFTETNEHLNDLQKNIVQGLLNGESYKEIAEHKDYDEGYIGDLSRKLYKILSKHLKEDINKHNFSWTIERSVNSQLINIVNGNISHCPNNSQDFSQNKNKNFINQCYQNLTLAPEIIKCCAREGEFNILNNWICNQIRLISVLGLSGMGKSYLVKRFIDLNLGQFEVVIWKNLRFSSGLDEVINEVLNIKTSDFLKKSDVCKFFDILKDKKCLIIFDNVEELFISGEFAGQFKPEFCEYQNFFKMMTEIEHQSSLILISQEKCTEMNSLDKELYPVKCLELSGLNNTEILINMGLKEEECWLNLVNLYQGNPVYLQDIAVLIKEFYDGKVSNFLAENQLIISQEVSRMLTLLYNRLSPQEKEVICAINKLNKPVSREELSSYLNLSSLELINSLKSLKSRYLLTQINGNFDVIPVFKEYVINFLNI